MDPQAVNALVLVGGLAALLLSGDFLVRGSVGIARRAHIPPLLVGLTIIAFGTSAPELVVSLLAVFKSSEAATIAVGNVVGSNIANIFLVLGVPSLFLPMLCDAPTVKRNTLAVLGATFLFIGMCWDGAVTAPEGLALFILLIAFLVTAGISAMRARRVGKRAAELQEAEEELAHASERLGVSIALTVIGLIGLPISAYFVVESAVEIARSFNISPALIGLTAIAIGTSLPELATTLTAALRKHAALAMGNVLGSNLFNILAIIGITALAAPAPVPVEPHILAFDIWVMLAAALVLLPIIYFTKRIGRFTALIFVLAYAAYLGLLVQASLSGG